MQDAILLLSAIIILLVPVMRIVQAVRSYSSNKQEPITRSLTHPKTPKLKKAPPQKPYNAWEEPAYALSKTPISRAKKILNRASLKQSLLINEILRRKY